MKVDEPNAVLARHRPALLATLFGVLVYAGILSFPGRAIAHNREVMGLVVLATVILAVWLIRHRALPRLQPATLVLVIATAAAASWSTREAASLAAAEARLALYVACATFGLLAWAAIAEVARATLRRSLMAICLVHLACLIAFLLALATRDAGVVPEREYVPDFANVRHFGYLGFLAASAGFAFAVLVPRWRLVGVALAVSALFGVLLLGSRGALVAWLLFMILLAAFLGRQRRALGLSALAAILAAQVLVYGFRFVQADDVPQPSGVVERLVVTETAFTTSGRGPVWRQSLAAIGKRPWFGYGPEGYKTSKCCDKRFVHPHNAALQFMLEFGIVGTLLAGALLATILMPALRALWRGLRRGNVAPELAVACALLFSFLAFAMVDGLLYHAIPLVHFVWLCALLPGLAAEPADTASAAPR